MVEREFLVSVNDETLRIKGQDLSHGGERGEQKRTTLIP